MLPAGLARTLEREFQLMSKSAAGDANIATVSRVLALLARKGAWAEKSPCENGASELAVFGRAAGAPALLGRAARTVYAPALAKGWIARDAAGKWRLTRAGQDYLRRALAGDGGAKASPPSAPARAKPAFDGAESPLSWLMRRKMIGEAEFNAGERFRADFHAAHMTPRVTTNWSEPLGGSAGGRGAGRSPLEFPERAAAAQERVRRALAAAGPELSGVLIDVCGHLTKLEDVERARQWPKRSAKLVLEFALSSLARHYGYTGPSGRSGGGGVRHWGAPDYKPEPDLDQTDPV